MCPGLVKYNEDNKNEDNDANYTGKPFVGIRQITPHDENDNG